MTCNKIKPRVAQSRGVCLGQSLARMLNFTKAGRKCLSWNELEFLCGRMSFCSSPISDAAMFVVVSVLLSLKLSTYTCSLWWTSRERKPNQVDSEANPDLWTAEKKTSSTASEICFHYCFNNKYLPFVPNSYLIPPYDITLFEKWSVVRVVITYWHNKKDKRVRKSMCPIPLTLLRCTKSWHVTFPFCGDEEDQRRSQGLEGVKQLLRGFPATHILYIPQTWAHCAEIPKD